MKKVILAVVIALAFTGIVSARGRRLNPDGVSQSVTGTLAVRNGTIALEGETQVYYVPGLERFIGFIEGLKEGAQVTVEGYVYDNQTYAWLQPSKLTLNGKDYEVGNNLAQGPYDRRGGRHNRGYGRWCH
jgi:hypothetical protein